MTQIELTTDSLARNMEMFKMTVADFSDADFLVRPCPGANHAAWQIGHLLGAETWMVNSIKPGAGAPLPPEWEGKFSKETAGKDDAGYFPSKSALMDQLAKTRAASIAWAKTLTPADLDKPGPQQMAKMAPTVGHVLGLMMGHTMMHMGQLQVIRRKLGKPVLF
jgi:DinB superfamily